MIYLLGNDLGSSSVKASLINAETGRLNSSAEKIHKIMLPGDYIAMRMTGIASTTVSGLSEGMFWDFSIDSLADFLLDHYGIDLELIPETIPTFGDQGRLTQYASAELNLRAGIPVSYRAGDQPNNAFSLRVLEPESARRDEYLHAYGIWYNELQKILN